MNYIKDVLKNNINNYNKYMIMDISERTINIQLLSNTHNNIIITPCRSYNIYNIMKELLLIFIKQNYIIPLLYNYNDNLITINYQNIANINFYKYLLYNNIFSNDNYIINSNINDKITINYFNPTLYNMNLIPKTISISTITINCHLGFFVNIKNVYRYILLDDNDIVAIKSREGYKCIDKYIYKFRSISKNSNKNFYNQNTMIIKINKDRFINVKLFKNGSLQMTGCKSLLDFDIIINKLINKLKEIYIINIYNKYIEINFTNPLIENIVTISNFKINLINSNFSMNYFINKDVLFKILIDNNIICRISVKHPCVNVTYKNYDNKYIRIFIFQTGKIIIGANSPEYIKDAYYYIVKLLNNNKFKIMKRDITKLLTSEEINKVITKYSKN